MVIFAGQDEPGQRRRSLLAHLVTNPQPMSFSDDNYALREVTWARGSPPLAPGRRGLIGFPRYRLERELAAANSPVSLEEIYLVSNVVNEYICKKSLYNRFSVPTQIFPHFQQGGIQW